MAIAALVSVLLVLYVRNLICVVVGVEAATQARFTFTFSAIHEQAGAAENKPAGISSVTSPVVEVFLVTHEPD